MPLRRLDPIEIEPDAWCGWCGDPLPEPAERVHNKTYCSVECRDAAKADRRKCERVHILCPECGTRFLRTSRVRVFCCHRCANRHHKRRKRQGDKTRYR